MLAFLHILMLLFNKAHLDNPHFISAPRQASAPNTHKISADIDEDEIFIQ